MSYATQYNYRWSADVIPPPLTSVGRFGAGTVTSENLSVEVVLCCTERHEYRNRSFSKFWPLQNMRQRKMVQGPNAGARRFVSVSTLWFVDQL